MPLCLKDQLTSIGSSAASKVRVTGGTEIIDNELNAAIFGIAKGNGLSAQDLVVGFNRKDPNVLKLLSKGDTDTLEGLVERLVCFGYGQGRETNCSKTYCFRGNPHRNDRGQRRLIQGCVYTDAYPNTPSKETRQ